MNSTASSPTDRPDTAPEATTTNGPVRGVAESGVAVFRGIPYAAPPFGDLRFAAPAPPQPWTEPLTCTAYGPTVPKGPYRKEARDLLPEPVVEGDDCLNLNVWTPTPLPADPAAEGASGLPVLVWIHGGAFVNGSGAVPIYAGDRFARDGVVTVTINYRLGVDGFAHLPDAPDNRGLLDQVAALEWVRDNIAAFGGDPQRVTIAGESAGAMSVTTLTAMPAAQRLFRRVIAQSGAGHHVLSRETARQVSGALAERLGVEATAAGLAAVPLDELVAAQLALLADIAAAPTGWGEIAINSMPFEPVVDGESLTGRPYDVIAAGGGAKVDLLIGTNDTEHTLFLYPLAAAIDEPTARMILGAYGAADDAYDVLTSSAGVAGPFDALVAGLTDFFFRVPALRLAESRLEDGRDTFVYQFGWETPVLDGVLRSTHALEIGFAFDTLDVPEAQWMAGPDAPQALADEMHAAWVAFVRDGDPGWAAYGEAGSTRRFGGRADGEVLDDPDAERRLVWSDR